ncbi:MAG: hypothetical protein VB070_05260 [Clostridiaceae bacterium]|nr:hypothetical protein [Clostridiaceae bacterium]
MKEPAKAQPRQETADCDIRYNFGPLEAQDDLGRKLPLRTRAGSRRHNRWVGMFYFLCNPAKLVEDKPVYDVSKILAADPDAGKKPDSPLWGPPGSSHFWGEPLFGYYAHDDEWVIRRHMIMLILAEIDFLVFDTTNYASYPETVEVILKVLEEYRQDGWPVPKIVYYTNSESGRRIQEIYDFLYRPGRYPQLWFYWDDKPLIIGDPDQCSPETREFFTFRLNQWPTEPNKPGGFPWIAFERPQPVFYRDNGQPEVVSVSIAQHPQILFGDSALYGEPANRGRSFHEGRNDLTRDAGLWGYNFAEQWERALSVDPEIVFITGWNEWTFGRVNGVPERPIAFIDAASREFSRDIEPMRGGHFDLYYLQMIRYIREYKGTADRPETSGPKTIDLDGGTEQWADVQPTYRGFPGTSLPRNHPGFGSRLYQNFYQSNELRVMKVAQDDQNIFFYAECSQDIEPYSFTPWMWLLIGIVGRDDDCWLGYHYLINNIVLNQTETFLQRCLGGFRWSVTTRLAYRLSGKTMQIAIPQKALGLPEGQQPLTLRFKWADHVSEDRVADIFYCSGSVSPYGRLNFLYQVGP